MTNEEDDAPGEAANSDDLVTIPVGRSPDYRILNADVTTVFPVNGTALDLVIMANDAIVNSQHVRIVEGPDNPHSRGVPVSIGVAANFTELAKIRMAPQNAMAVAFQLLHGAIIQCGVPIELFETNAEQLRRLTTDAERTGES